ncbi:hypothetical protein C900_03287 [Fulvivirga imtechensis AK7]|uniref:DUF6265 domain-containing protein n=1 Tax=Fulvivirga imtechensis AK7 TaxID=1237149 RepID=L8JU83_9BACT|nr:DUF6265 family protein [Fulvivirga imtechensis]ELR70852.1 hypothetical protein C900_03287 [Fulvivirga imtechensis AK7]
MKITVLILAGLLKALTVQAQSTGREKPVFSWESAQWLTGYWVGDGFGGVSEEIWAPAKDNTMMCMYRHIKDDKVTFYEFVHLTPEGMKLKHFNPDLTGWEEKDKFVTFPLLGITEDKIIFDGLEIWRKSGNEMDVTLTYNQNGQENKEVFHYRRRVLE